MLETFLSRTSRYRWRKGEREIHTQRKRERETERDRERNIPLRLDGMVQGVSFFGEFWLWKSAVWMWFGYDRTFSFLHSFHHQLSKHQQHYATTLNTSKQLARCSFDHICCWMDSALFSNMLKETRTVRVDDVGQGFHEVGRYGKTCLYSLWIPVVKSAVRIWIGLDVFFFITHFATNTSSTTQPHKIPANNLRNAIFTMCVLAWVLSCFPTCWKRHMQ